MIDENIDIFLIRISSMTIILNQSAENLIMEHLVACYGFTKNLNKYVPNKINEINPILNQIETHKDIAWFLIDKYLNLEEPAKVLDIYRTNLHIGYNLTHLQNDPTLDIIETLSTEIERMIDAIKID